MKPRVLSAVAVVLASSVTVRVIGLVKNILAAHYFGTSGEMDDYLLALLLPDLAMQLARTGAFNFIPVFAAERERSEGSAWGAAGRMLGYWLLLLVAALVIVLLVSPHLMGLLAPGLGMARRAQTLDLTRLLLLMAAPVGLSRLLALTLQADRRFLAAAASEVVFQVISTAYLVVFHAGGIEMLAAAQICGGFAQLVVVAAGLLGDRHRLRPRLDLQSAPVRRTIGLTLPVYVGDLGDKLNLMVNRAFASLLPPGAVSGLQYAQTLSSALPTLLAGALTSTLFPFFSRDFARGDDHDARGSLSRAMVTTSLFFLPLSAGIWLLARIMVWVLYEHGSFDAASTELTVSALQIFAPASFAIALNALLGSAFQARHDTLTPAKAGLLRVASNIAFCGVFVPDLGYRGIALAITVAHYLKLLALLVFARRILGGSVLRGTLVAAMRALLAVGVMVTAMYPLLAQARHRFLPLWVELLSLLVLAAWGALAYTGGLWLFSRDELRAHAAMLRDVLRGGRSLATPAAASGHGVPQLEARP